MRCLAVLALSYFAHRRHQTKGQSLYGSELIERLGLTRGRNNHRGAAVQVALCGSAQGLILIQAKEQ
jgi:hypothetical protein